MAFLRCPQCAVKCGTHYIPYEVLRLLKMGFRRLEHAESRSLLKKYLTETMVEQMKFLKTSNRVNLYDCITCGLENFDCEIGVFACDAESYFVFWPIFFPVLQEIHGFSPTDVHPKSCWQPVEDVLNLEDKDKYIKLTRVRVTRNFKGYPFCPQMSVKQFEEIEQLIKMLLELMTGDLDGTYEHIGEITDKRIRELKKKQFYFDNKDKYFEPSGVYRNWPHGRGIFHNPTENFLVWINPHDHLKVISLEYGGNLRKAYQRTMKAMRKLSRDLSFIFSERMGYVTTCPSDMGTGMKISMHILLPKLSEYEELLYDKADDLGITVKKICQKEGLYEIFNRKRLGVTEIEIARTMQNAAMELINSEQMMIDFTL
ncbi:hypothetical protein WA026_020390 [Henosepilachna vigintioctopunctata]|uniref:arginine kinase n=1 Tax=Henosepilachna vigintioctopunctata TaxID=420089 RepID=A0AAW1UFB3_9CUCU